jgi:hypothetical protein
MEAAYFISPKGEVIYCGNKHITKVIENPKKFGLDKGVIEYLYDFYNEKFGTEGKAREQIIISLINQGWVRIRKYGDKFWTVNVNKLDGKVKQILNKWSNLILKGINGIKEIDPYIPVKIVFPTGNPQTTTMKSMSDDKNFVVEDFELKLTDIKDMKDLPLYECFKFKKILSKYVV